MVYQIKDWDLHFENNKSRERDACSFVCVPNKQHGLGFSRIMAEKDGAAIYGVWHMIVGMCSRQRKPRNGWLTSDGRAPDGHQTGTPLAPMDLSLLWRRPVEEIDRALSFLSSEAVGWLLVVKLSELVPAECPPSAREVPAECPRREGKEEKGSGGNHPDLSKCIAHFKAMGAPYTKEEIARVFNSFEATAQNGLWYFGKRPVTDWRAAMETRLGEARNRNGAPAKEKSQIQKDREMLQ